MKAVFFLLFSFFTFLSCDVRAAENSKPNFLIIIADDMGFSDTGCYGGEIATPNLDRLAGEGLRFTQMYSTARCWPSRSCLLTGYYAQQIRMDPYHSGNKIPRWARVLPHYLEPLGYRTYHSGKWHLHGAPKPVGDGGFNRSFCLHDHDRYFAPKHILLDDEPLPPIPDGTDYYVTDAIAEHSIGFLEQHASEHREQPFLLYLAFTAPHFPLQAPAEDVARYLDKYVEGWDNLRAERLQRLHDLGIVDCPLSPRDPKTIPGWNLKQPKLKKLFGEGEVETAAAWDELTPEQKKYQSAKMAVHAAMIDRMDRQIGRVLEQLKKMDAFDNTVIMFVSDNGASAEQIVRGNGHDCQAPPGSAKTYQCLGPGWSTAANTPFRMHKSWVHEGGISSPFIVHWPKGIAQGGQLRRTPCHFIDILPTVLDLAEAMAEGDWQGETSPPLPGQSLVPAFRENAELSRDCLYWHHLDNSAIRVGDWKLVRGLKDGKTGLWELYNFRTDRSETHDLAEKHPEKVKELAGLWKECEEKYQKQAAPKDDKPDAGG